MFKVSTRRPAPLIPATTALLCLPGVASAAEAAEPVADVLFAILLITFIVGLWRGLRKGAVGHADAVLYPVSSQKFFVMSLATGGAYTILWFWRNWRWVKAHGRPAVTPYFRAFFYPFFVYPLFAEASQRAGSVRFSKGVGVGCAVAFLLLTIMGSLGAGALPFLVALALASACLLPILRMINGANPPESGALAAHSRFTRETWAAIACGLLFWILMGWPSA